MKVRQSYKLGFRVFQLILFLVLLVHWSGCLWYLIVKERDTWMPPKDEEQRVTIFYDTYSGEKYLIVCYYSLLLLVGNDIYPKNLAQTVFSSMVLICGSLIFSFIFGNITAVMSSMNKKQNRFSE